MFHHSSSVRVLRIALVPAAVLAAAGLAAAQPLFLYGVDGDDDTMVRVDVNAATPTAELLGLVVHGGNPVTEMEAMTWDHDFGRLIVVSNAGLGPVYRIDPNDITAPPPADIPASFVGNTNTIQMEGIALQPVESVYYGVDNTTDPSRLVKVSRFTGTVIEIVGPLEDALGANYDNMEGLAFTFEAPYVLYGANNPGEGLGQLVTIDTATGLVTPIGAGIGFENVECLAFAPDGTLYGFSNAYSQPDRFITIDPVTGIGTEFSTIDADQFDIEGCAFLEADHNVGVARSSWSDVKRLYE